MNAAVLDWSRNLHVWIKADDRNLLAGIDAGLCVHEIAEDLQREPISVLKRISTIGTFTFASGSEEWVEVMSLALSGVPLQDVIAWCSASEERMPYELLDVMRSTPDQRSAFELARQLGLEVANVSALPDLVWLAEQPEQTQLGYAAAAERVLARFDALTPTTLHHEVLGLAPAELRWNGSPAAEEGARGECEPEDTSAAEGICIASAQDTHSQQMGLCQLHEEEAGGLGIGGQAGSPSPLFRPRGRNSFTRRPPPQFRRWAGK